jgi:hypothetical protein
MISIKNVFCPALAYQFSIAPCSIPLLKRLSSAESFAFSKHLQLLKAFPASFTVSNCAFGAKEMESVFLAKLLGDLYIALQKGSGNNKIANAFLAQLNYQMCDQNSVSDNPFQTNGYGFHNSFLQTSNLMAQYMLSLGNDNKPMKNRITSTLIAPV